MARLTYSQRKGLKRSRFVFPKKKTAANPAGRGAYPIPDAAHARSALQRVSQFGSPSEQATVRAAVRRRYPSISIGGMLQTAGLTPKPQPSTTRTSSKSKKKGT